MLKWLAALVVFVALAAGSFAYLHTGARADALCDRKYFVSGGETSLWPPGARCSYGLPEQTSVTQSAD
mgnify:CR=1 FL=1